MTVKKKNNISVITAPVCRWSLPQALLARGGVGQADGHRHLWRGQALGTPRLQTLHWLCSYKGCGRTGDPERAPIQRRQPKTPQKKTLFPSESFQVDGSGGPAVAPILGTHPSPEIKNMQHTELESWAQTAALNWRARGCPGFACWLSLTKWNSKACGEKNCSSSNVWCLVHSPCVSNPTVTGKKPLMNRKHQ